MRMYLSSYRLGDHVERMLALLDPPGPVAVIGNAIDTVPPAVRRQLVSSEISALRALGLDAVEMDLRDYFGVGHRPRLTTDLGRFRMVWLRGGNVFMLRHALARSGGDDALKKALSDDALVYGGYSAGCCVLAPSLRGCELVDPPGAVREHYGADPIWDGLGLLDYAIVPHYDSELGGEEVELVVARYREEGVPHRTLRDGDAIVIDG
jgi:dipeptidase E